MLPPPERKTKIVKSRGGMPPPLALSQRILLIGASQRGTEAEIGADMTSDVCHASQR